MAFGNGFLCHPLMGFWIMQHLCHSVEHGDHQIGMQPTMSYSGSPLWNLLNFNALSHVEHHDFARCPWTRLHKLRVRERVGRLSGLVFCVISCFA